MTTPNRLEIRNPGYSLKSQERFDEPGSTLRNPFVAEILHETRFAETKGSGVRIMRQKMTEMGLAEPTFTSSRDDNNFSAIFLFHHFLSEEDWSWLSRFSEYALDNDQIRAMIFVREMGAIDNAAYRHLCQVDIMAASMSLRKLRGLRLLDLRGSGSRAYYVPGETFTAINGSSPTIHVSSASIHAKPVGIHAPRPPSVGSLPSDLASRVERLGKRMTVEAAEAIILQICRHKPSSGEEIATILGRTKQYVTQKYLYQMAKRGLLVFLYPEMLKHPQQKYKTPDVEE
jgi:ATP-dependent DNA helicase RecG